MLEPNNDEALINVTMNGSEVLALMKLIVARLTQLTKKDVRTEEEEEEIHDLGTFIQKCGPGIKQKAMEYDRLMRDEWN